MRRVGLCLVDLVVRGSWLMRGVRVGRQQLYLADLRFLVFAVWTRYTTFCVEGRDFWCECDADLFLLV